jgi:hypothetical protein
MRIWVIMESISRATINKKTGPHNPKLHFACEHFGEAGNAAIGPLMGF